MKKKILMLTMVCLMGFCVGCGAQPATETKTEGSQTSEKKEETPEKKEEAPEKKEETSEKEETSYQFADMQGTSEVYSDIIMNLENGEWKTSIGIYRLTTFEGLSVKLSDLSYEFTDEEVGVKGTITMKEDKTAATFEITETTWPLVNVGDTFEFDTRR